MWCAQDDGKLLNDVIIVIDDDDTQPIFFYSLSRVKTLLTRKVACWRGASEANPQAGSRMFL